MDELEQGLKSRLLAAPSAQLDRRVHDAFGAARSKRKRLPGTFYGWVAVVSGMAATLLVMLLHRSPAKPGASETVVHGVEASGLMREMLLNPAADRDGLSDFVVQVNSN